MKATSRRQGTRMDTLLYAFAIFVAVPLMVRIAMHVLFPEPER